MNTITTEAWVLHRGNSPEPEPATLQKESFTFPDITPDEVLVEPIYGCWEANMDHALNRQPIDICAFRGEEEVVIGNSGVVRTLKLGSAVTGLKEGQLCLLVADIDKDPYGYTVRVLAYDALQTVGLLAKRSKMPARCLIPLSENSSLSPKEWAAFSVRYITAWENWRVAYGCWQVQMPDIDPAEVHVWGWGGGVSLAQLALANYIGCQTAMIASTDERLNLIWQSNIQAIDRRQFSDLYFNEKKYKSDEAYKEAYKAAEKTFLNLVEEHTQGQKVSIFIDNIGLPVFRATIKALARQAVLATSGWKHGMQLSILRGAECINRHTHVHTHGSRAGEDWQALAFAEKNNWRPPVANDRVYTWDEIPQLVADYQAGRIESYFPLFEVNKL